MLTTARLTLRAARQDDLNDLFDIYSDASAMRYWSSLPHADRSVTQENLNRMMANAQGVLTYFVIEHKGRVIGSAGLHREDEVGFILHSDHWRQGMITEAMTAIIPYLFAHTQVTQLTADVDPRNTASVNCLKNLGFQETAVVKNTYCIDGEWSDSVYLALPRS